MSGIGPVLELRNLNMMRGGKQVLFDLSLNVARGEVLFVIGPSGSGKSSLLRCLNLLHPVPMGTVYLSGEDVTRLNVPELRRRVGMVFQKAAMFAGTVADNIRYGPELRGETLSEEEVLDLMRQAALEEDLLNGDAQQLSGGQEQRLCVARALANQPEVLLLDEPTSALDPVATHEVEEALLRLQRSTGLTLIWVSHDAPQAERVADRVLFLEAGRVGWLGRKNDMAEDDGVRAFAQGLSRAEREVKARVS